MTRFSAPFLPLLSDEHSQGYLGYLFWLSMEEYLQSGLLRLVRLYYFIEEEDPIISQG